MPDQTESTTDEVAEEELTTEELAEISGGSKSDSQSANASAGGNNSDGIIDATWYPGSDT